MTRNTPEEKQGGCFAWLIRAKKAVNERWARARNALRRRLARDNKWDKPLTAEDMVNETGSPDLVISKIRVASPNLHGSTGSIRNTSPIVDAVSVKTPSRSEAPKGHGDEHVGVIVQPNIHQVEDIDKLPTMISSGSDGNPDFHQVRSFVMKIIDRAAQELEAARTQAPDAVIDETNNGHVEIIKDANTDGLDKVFMTSSVVSALADDVVHRSLTNIVNDLETTTMPVVQNSSSLSSGAISAIAEAAVTESLTSILTYSDKNDVNYSARSRPRTVTEMLETLSIDPTIGQLCEDGDFPACLP